MINTLNTGNRTLDMEIPLLTPQELGELARYAGYLRWARAQKDSDNWADAPLTLGEELALSAGRENVRRGDFLTLEEFKEQAATA